MKNVTKVLRRLFGSKTSKENDYRTWAKTEYGKDWRYAYEYMIAHNKAPKSNPNLKGWV
tara:strand:- start:100 stop:276 length:177 start_codon:yes stop_codon:yes gene_type:complete